MKHLSTRSVIPPYKLLARDLFRGSPNNKLLLLALGHPPQPDDIVSLMTLYTLDTEWINFIVPEGAMQASWVEKSSAVFLNREPSVLQF